MCNLTGRNPPQKIGIFEVKIALKALLEESNNISLKAYYYCYASVFLCNIKALPTANVRHLRKSRSHI